MALNKVSFDVNIWKGLEDNAHDNLPLSPVIFMQDFSTALHIFQKTSETLLDSTKLKIWP